MPVVWGFGVRPYAASVMAGLVADAVGRLVVSPSEMYLRLHLWAANMDICTGLFMS